LAAAGGIALVVFVLASSRMLAAGLERTLLRSGSDDKALVMQSDAYSEGDSRLRSSVVGLVASAPGVSKTATGNALVSGECVVQVNLSRHNDPTQYTSVQIRGVSDMAYQVRREVKIVQGRRAKPGTREAVVGKGLIGRYSGLTLTGGFELQKNQPLEIVGVFDAGGSAYDSEVWADLDQVRSAFGFAGYVSSVTAQLHSRAAFDGFVRTLRADKRLGLGAERERSYYEKISEELGAFIAGLGSVVAAIFSFGAMLGAAMTMYGAVSQRRKEFAVLRAIGFRRAHVLGAVVFEALALSAVGSVIGVVLALSTQLIQFSTVNWGTGQALTFPFLPSAGVLATSLIGGTLVGVMGGLFPALRAWRMNPVDAMRV
jgi:putative ABC transport system permease protein